MKKQKYYLGLDIGTDSVGYAVTDEKYNLLKLHGEPAWGVTVFDAAALCTDRRAFRTARRRLDRRQQRIDLLQELFANEIGKIDSRFFIRQQESRLFRNETEDQYIYFNDENYSDRDYYRQYPTIHHLICDLMNNDESRDIRLLYIACAWIIAHRGHFLSNIRTDNIEKVKDFQAVYDIFCEFFRKNEYEMPWDTPDIDSLSSTLKESTGVNSKKKRLIALLFNGKKPSKEITEEFPFNREAIITLLAGGTCKVKDLFENPDYEELGSFSLLADDDRISEILTNIGDDGELVSALRGISDWAVLIDALNGQNTISEAKVLIYEQHKKDLSNLKYVINKYVPEKYNEIFRDENRSDNYTAYAYHTNSGSTAGIKNKASVESFSKYVGGILKKIVPDKKDEKLIQEMIERLSVHTFMPKQKTTDNRVLPHQLYEYELKKILENNEKHFSFLNKTDEDGLTVKDKIISIFLYRIPYFVGPLNEHSPNAWIVRKAGKIYPWNFEKIVDLDASEQQFIQKLTNYCTYLPGEPVLPKDSLMYHRFMVLNEINNIRINGVKIPVELKQRIYNELFMNVKKVTRKKLENYLISNGIIEKGEEDQISGIDITINSNLTSQISLKKLMETTLSEEEAESIIMRSTYAEDKIRLRKWLEKQFPMLSEPDKKYICSLRFHDFGKLSKRFLCGVEGAFKDTGEVFTILGALWETQDNLMELLSDRYTFSEVISAERNAYYQDKNMSLSDRLDEMYISNAVKRHVFRTNAIIKDVVKAFGKPEKIFIETTRGGTSEQRGKRTKPRKQQILDLYKLCKDEDVRNLQTQLEAMGELADNKLQSDRLFLYYLQLGRSMYSGRPLELEKLGSKEYDIDHIYPQAVIKDDSIINNKVLVLSEENGKKSDKYPIAADIRQKMGGFWLHLKDIGLISEEKYKRLVRGTPFSEQEKLAFINRQLTETSQAVKAVANVLKEKYPETEIVYCKAGLVSDFRQEFEIYKCRSFNDLHHAVDAYLNIVTGNVYSMKFTKPWFRVDLPYSMKTRTLFTRPLICNGVTVWDGDEMLKKVKRTAVKNNAHFTKFAFFKKGGFFDQMPVSAAEGLVPLKKDLPTNKYGGYNKSGAMFYLPVKYHDGKKKEIIIMSVELLYGKRFLADQAFAIDYSYKRLKQILGKDVYNIEFPMGMRPWKVNTVLSLDGFRVCISGIASGGKCLIAQPIMQFSENEFWQFYLKKIERLVEKVSLNASYVYSEKYDQVSRDKNTELYALYIRKYKETIYKKRVNAPIEILIKGKERFEALDVIDQAKALLNIHATFGRIASGCDLTLVGGGAHAGATVNFSSKISNWKKNYSCVTINDYSSSGLWCRQSENLLLLL